MLILTAKPGESIWFTTPAGDEIEAVYLGKDHNHAPDEIRIGFTAPTDISIERDIVRERRLNREIQEAYLMDGELSNERN